MAYIERESAIKSLLNDSPEQVGYSREDAADCIRYMDAVDVASVRHGKWEDYPSDRYKRCTACKLEFEKAKLPKTLNYCPNCEAYMRGEKE